MKAGAANALMFAHATDALMSHQNFRLLLK